MLARTCSCALIVNVKLPYHVENASEYMYWMLDNHTLIKYIELQGHCHPKIMKALVEQAEKLTLSSRAFYNDRFPVYAEHLSSMFGYDMVLPMNTGAEGVETALKLARKWGFMKKKIPRDEVYNVFFLLLVLLI